MDSPIGSTEQALGIKDVAAVFDVSVDTLRRRIRDGKLPEARLVAGKYGDTYELPMGDLSAVAEREGWVLDLSAAAAHGNTPLQPGASTLPGDYIDRLVAAETAAETTRQQLQQLEKERNRARSDLEHEQSERLRLESELAAESTASAVLRQQLADKQEEAQRTGLELEAANSRAASLEQESAVANARVAEIRAELEHERSTSEDLRQAGKLLAEDVTSLAGERRALEHELQRTDQLATQLKESMGWWSRRRFDRRAHRRS